MSNIDRSRLVLFPATRSLWHHPSSSDYSGWWSPAPHGCDIDRCRESPARECECARKGLGFSVSAEVAAMCQEPAGIGGPETARLRVQFS